jgi:hypothetical protein
MDFFLILVYFLYLDEYQIQSLIIQNKKKIQSRILARNYFSKRG